MEKIKGSWERGTVKNKLDMGRHINLLVEKKELTDCLGDILFCSFKLKNRDNF